MAVDQLEGMRATLDALTTRAAADLIHFSGAEDARNRLKGKLAAVEEESREIDGLWQSELSEGLCQELSARLGPRSTGQTSSGSSLPSRRCSSATSTDGPHRAPFPGSAPGGEKKEWMRKGALEPASAG